ncbi:hypothetical protein KEM52_000606 [Ascosphaera acerosa]|nr:hypothetical protein KEM52_000606 [Ascosphaera acerosa]
MATARQQPAWAQPAAHPDVKLPALQLHNSLTRSKVPFIPIDPAGKKVTWYACGPTVYDDAHLGHARNYVSTDVLRRIMRDYFKFEVEFVMNITDVDDKIITRGRQQYLFREFRREHPAVDEQAVETVREALRAYLAKNLPLVDAGLEPAALSGAVAQAYADVLAGKAVDGSDKAGDKEAKIKMHIRTATAAADALATVAAVTAPTAAQSDAFYTHVQDVVLPHLDKLHGATIPAERHEIFTELTKRYEARFMQDVRDLNCLDPDTVTRVTEYMPEIVRFVARIVEHGYGYVTSDGSVYFDIAAFEADGNPYARLEPWNRNDSELQADGEGALTAKTAEKRSDADFALWKASKPGEPAWPSPWGKGRPGWHIECSAMASSTFGRHMDIHSGGIDLAFPHHDNELAQSEAYWHDKLHGGHEQWVNYFVHMGHLSIQGSKMSKSLKNFTTIRAALEKGDYTARSLRILFLLGGWKDGVEITEDLIKAARGWEERVNNFFIKTREVLDQSAETGTATPTPTTTPSELAAALSTAQDAVHAHLCNSFNTPGAMQALSELISAYNVASEKTAVPARDVEAAGRWVTSMVNIFGLNGAAAPDSDVIGWTGLDVPEAAKPFLGPLSHMRDTLRADAKSKAITKASLDAVVANGRAALQAAAVTANSADTAAAAKPFESVLASFCTQLAGLEPAAAGGAAVEKEILGLCDRLRDVELFDLGVYLEDREGQPARVRPVTRELVQAREEKEARARQKQREKEAREQEALRRAEKGRLSPAQMFRTAEFSAWDADGLPLKDAQGVELTKSRAKKLRKDWERQKKLHEAWLATSGATAAASSSSSS